jgi:hypothetical protein
MKSCRICLNNEANPTIIIQPNDLCNVCNSFSTQDKNKQELDFILSLTKKEGAALIGLSGGKDSTATLIEILKYGIKPLGFTFDLGYYPRHIFSRAKLYADQMGVAHEIIDIRKYITPEIKKCYQLTALFYENNPSKEIWKKLYQKNRQCYSAKNCEAIPFIRSCQICRKVVIRAYYTEALKRNCIAIFLGMNEWTHLSGTNYISGIRRLQPNIDKPPVYIVHWPFLMHRTFGQTCHILESKALDWSFPESERGVTSNSNSCLFARAAEQQASEALGFHPDTTRLSREITCGYITKEMVRQALAFPHKSDRTVKQVLQDAEII